MGLLSRIAEERARQPRRVVPPMADAERYRPSDGVGVKADDPEPPKYAKVTLIVEDDEKTTTLVVDRARLTTELVPNPADEERLRREEREDSYSGFFRVHRPARPGLFRVHIFPHPDDMDSWGTVRTFRKPTQPTAETECADPACREHHPWAHAPHKPKEGGGE